MKTLKVIDVLNMQQALTALAAIKLPFKTSYRISKALNQVAQVINATQKKQQALFKSMGAPTEDGQQIQIPADQQAEFQVLMQAIMDAEIEIDIMPVHISSLEGITIEPAHLAALDGFMISTIAELESAV